MTVASARRVLREPLEFGKKTQIDARDLLALYYEAQDLAAKLWVECKKCYGTGRYECPECGHSGECGDCFGGGAGNDYEERLLRASADEFDSKELLEDLVGEMKEILEAKRR